METGSEIGHFTQCQLLLTPCSTHLPHNDQPSMDAHAERKLDAFGLWQPLIEGSQSMEDTQPSTDGSLCVIFMGLGIAKVHEKPIPKQLGDMAIVVLDDFRTSRLIGTDDFPVLFGIELG